MIAKRLTQNSSCEKEFDRAAPTHSEEVATIQSCNTTSWIHAHWKNRTRNIIWFNPPFNLTVHTNIGKEFFKLLDKNLPKHHSLHKIINWNKVKLSYSCTPSLTAIILAHNKNLLQEKTENPPLEKLCNCRKNITCPLNGKCCSSFLVYRATLTHGNDIKYYCGLCEILFKTRYNSHQHTFKKNRK